MHLQTMLKNNVSKDHKRHMANTIESKAHEKSSQETKSISGLETTKKSTGL